MVIKEVTDKGHYVSFPIESHIDVSYELVISCMCSIDYIVGQH